MLSTTQLYLLNTLTLAQVEELEGVSKRLKERCSALLHAANRYKDALAAMQTAEDAFATAVDDFAADASCEDAAPLTAGVMSKFSPAFR